MPSKCKECEKEYGRTDAIEQGFCDKWCEKAFCDREYEKKIEDQARTTLTVHTFKPYYNESENVMVTSLNQEKALHKSNGAGCIGDYDKIMDRMKFTNKNREEIIAERYEKIGLKYKKGERVLLDEKNMRFVPRR